MCISHFINSDRWYALSSLVEKFNLYLTINSVVNLHKFIDFIKLANIKSSERVNVCHRRQETASVALIEAADDESLFLIQLNLITELLFYLLYSILLDYFCKERGHESDLRLYDAFNPVFGNKNEL